MILTALLLAAAASPYEATITRDRLGIAHVEGARDADAVFGMITAQAEDDFARIERNYLENLGRLAEAEGESALWSDLRQRLWVDEEDLRARYAAAPADLKALCEAWAAGLNHYLATHPEVRPKVLTRFEPWMPLAFSEGSIGADYTQVPLAPLKALYGDGRGEAIARRAGADDAQGSNGIAIAPKLTADGRALLLINPHTTLFFRDVVHMTSAQGLDAYGAVTWGQFFVYQGFNRHMGWMHTTSGLDNVDEFAEAFVSDAEGSLAYRYGDEIRPITIRPIDIKVRRADGTLETRRFTTLATHHGPVTRYENGRFIATSLMFRPVEALAQSFERTKAAGLDEYLAIAEKKANSSNNTLIATADGRIALLMPQYLPAKDAAFDHHKVVDGSDPATDLGPPRALSELPQVIDPASGYVFNVNDEPWAAAGPGTLDPDAYPDDVDRFGWNPRTAHALRLLEGSQGWTIGKLQEAAYSPMQPAFDDLVLPLVEAWERLGEGDMKAALEAPVVALEAWDRRWDADDEVQALALTLLEVSSGRADREAPGRYGYEARHAYFATMDDEKRLEDLAQAVSLLTGQWGTWRVRWGDSNVYQRNDGEITQAFDDDKPALAVPFTPGWTGSLASATTVTPSGEKRRYNRHGNSFVAVVAFGKDGPEARMVTAGGVASDPASPHFDDQANNHVAGALQPVPLTREAIAAEATRRTRVSDR